VSMTFARADTLHAWTFEPKLGHMLMSCALPPAHKTNTAVGLAILHRARRRLEVGVGQGATLTASTPISPQPAIKNSA